MTSSAPGQMPHKCPTCGEHNDGKMQFCIFCGGNLVVPPQKHEEIAQSSIVTVPSFPAASALVCTVCHRTDPLQGQFCVFCGGRTSSQATSFEPSRQLPGLARTHQPGDRGHQHVSGEFSYAHVERSRPGTAGGAKQAAALVFAILLGAALGGGTGVGAIYACKDQLAPAILNSLWTGEGLLLYSTMPGANVIVGHHDEKSLYAGMTGKTGVLSIDNIHPGPYRVSVADGSHVIWKNPLVEAGKVTVVGYPEPLK